MNFVAELAVSAFGGGGAINTFGDGVATGFAATPISSGGSQVVSWITGSAVIGVVDLAGIAFSQAAIVEPRIDIPVIARVALETPSPKTIIGSTLVNLLVGAPPQGHNQ